MERKKYWGRDEKREKPRKGSCTTISCPYISSPWCILTISGSRSGCVEVPWVCQIAWTGRA
jgi:hypothetical protein